MFYAVKGFVRLSSYIPFPSTEKHNGDALLEEKKS
jgi:hypothetical protein